MPRRFFKRDIVPSGRRTMSAIFHVDVGAACLRRLAAGQVKCWRGEKQELMVNERERAQRPLTQAPCGPTCPARSRALCLSALRPDSSQTAAFPPSCASFLPGCWRSFECLLLFSVRLFFQMITHANSALKLLGLINVREHCKSQRYGQAIWKVGAMKK